MGITVHIHWISNQSWWQLSLVIIVPVEKCNKSGWDLKLRPHNFPAPAREIIQSCAALIKCCNWEALLISYSSAHKYECTLLLILLWGKIICYLMFIGNFAFLNVKIYFFWYLLQHFLVLKSKDELSACGKCRETALQYFAVKTITYLWSWLMSFCNTLKWKINIGLVFRNSL